MADVITYKNKVDLVTDTTTAEEYKWSAADANQVKSGINKNASAIDELKNGSTQIISPGGNWQGDVVISVIGKLVVMQIILIPQTLKVGDNVITESLPFSVNTAYTLVVGSSGSDFYGQGRLACTEKRLLYKASSTTAPVEVYCTLVTTLR